MEERLGALDRPWEMEWESGEGRVTLPPNTSVLDKFLEMGSGRTLLILGEPGGGKTTTLLELTRDLVAMAERDINHPIPVVFNLSSWGSLPQSLTSWLTAELYSKYQVAKSIGAAWVKNQQLLLLLDGLDEVQASRRDACVAALNKFLQDYGQTEIVVCSRIKDYEALSAKLRLQSALYLQPLKPEQIQAYLAGEELAALQQALTEDEVLQELAKSPLMLNIMAISYQGISPQDLPKLHLEQRRQHLFDAYIQRMFLRRGKSSQYSQHQAMQWLRWLAKQMAEKSQTVFLIERLQPSWLPSQWLKFIYFVSGGLTLFSVGVLILLPSLPFPKVTLLVIAALVLFDRIFGWHKIEPVSRLQWSGGYTIFQMILGTILGAIIVTLIRVIVENIFFVSHVGDIVYMIKNIPNYPLMLPNNPMLLRGLVAGMSLGFLIGTIRGLSVPGIAEIDIPNQGIWQSAKNALIFGIIGAAVMSIAAIVLQWQIVAWSIYGFTFGWVAGGGAACLKHLILRVVLYASGCIPWNYAKFLDRATELIFLQKVGGGYIFIHRLLLEHFAELKK